MGDKLYDALIFVFLPEETQTTEQAFLKTCSDLRSVNRRINEEELRKGDIVLETRREKVPEVLIRLR